MSVRCRLESARMPKLLWGHGVLTGMVGGCQGRWSMAEPSCSFTHSAPLYFWWLFQAEPRAKIERAQAHRAGVGD